MILVEKKMKNNLNLKGGVIIIGSLLWQDHLEDQDKDNIRKKWRNKNLDKNSKMLVKLPIRYGKKSTGNIYTMVFSNNCQRDNRLGTGYIFQFKSNPINNFKELLARAKAMSKAERIGKNLEKDWGKVTILFNPDKINPEIKKQILLEWKKQFKRKDRENYKFKPEKSCVNARSELNIEWPSPVNNQDAEALSQFDFLIATATNPHHNGGISYPSDSKVAETVKNDKDRRYFINNIKHGITTFQDNSIINKI